MEVEGLLFFQILDEKKECGTVFYNNTFDNNFEVDKMTHTWSCSPQLEDTPVEYANLWCGGATLDQICPEDLKDRWAEANKKAKAFLNSFKTAKINLADNCLFDLLPENFLLEFYELKNEIAKSVFQNFLRPKNYRFLVDLAYMLMRIKNRKLNLKFENLNHADKKVRNNFGKIRDVLPFIHYNPWTTATGRLATIPNSFPILNLNKELRSAIHPNNDFFVEFDYNAAELRVLFALLKQEQPKDDIHEWISTNIFKSKYDREATKKKVFAWLYNPKAKNKKLNDYLNRGKILENFYKDGCVTTPYDRKIAVEENKAVNYMIQSTASDLFLTSAIKIDKILKNKKSEIAFCVHDSLIIDMSLEDKDLLVSLLDEFSKTKFGNFKTSVSIGKDFGLMRKIHNEYSGIRKRRLSNR